MAPDSASPIGSLSIDGIDHHETVLVNATVLRDRSMEGVTGTLEKTVARRTPEVTMPTASAAEGFDNVQVPGIVSPKSSRQASTGTRRPAPARAIHPQVRPMDRLRGVSSKEGWVGDA